MQNVTIKGLAHEYKSLSEELSIPNVLYLLYFVNLVDTFRNTNKNKQT